MLLTRRLVPAGATARAGESDLAQRIYALAKELNIDSKVLVELCLKAGVTGKGSALASLTDEEEAKVRAHVSSSGGRTSAAVAARPVAAAATATVEAPVFRREDYIPPTGAGKPPVLNVKAEAPASESRRRSSDGDRAKSTPAIRVAPMPAAQQPTALWRTSRRRKNRTSNSRPMRSAPVAQEGPSPCKNICASMKRSARLT